MFSVVNSHLLQRLEQQVEALSSGLGPWLPGLLQEILPSGCQLRAGSLGPSLSHLLLRAEPAPLAPESLPSLGQSPASPSWG